MKKAAISKLRTQADQRQTFSDVRDACDCVKREGHHFIVSRVLSLRRSAGSTGVSARVMGEIVS